MSSLRKSYFLVAFLGITPCLQSQLIAYDGFSTTDYPVGQSPANVFGRGTGSWVGSWTNFVAAYNPVMVGSGYSSPAGYTPS